MTMTTETARCDEPEKALRSAGVLAPGNRHTCAAAPFPNAVAERPSPEPMPAELLEVVLLERAPLAKEHAIGGRLGVRPVLERRELKGADVVRELEEAVVGRGHEPVDHNVLPERVLDRLVNGLSDDGLPVVVVDLHPIESLEEGEVVEQGNDEVPLYGGEKLVGAVLVKLLLVRERDVAERNPFGEHGKTAEMALSRADGEPLVLLVAREQGPEVHGHVDKLFVSDELIVSGEGIAQAVVLFVKYESDQVVPGVAGVPRFVHKDGQLLHGRDLLANKNAGGHPPALGGRPLREDHLFYTTGNVLSSRRYYSKHTFVTQRKSAGKWRDIIDRAKQPDVKSHERLGSLRALPWRRRRCRGATRCRHRGLPSSALRSASLFSLGLRRRVPWLLLSSDLDDCIRSPKPLDRLARGAQKRTRLVRFTPCINYRKAA